MTNTTHGGARPKVREDDGRRNNSGPGRKPKSLTMKVGDNFFVGAKDKEGVAIADEYAWTVVEIERNSITIRSEVSGNTYRLLR